MTTKQGLCGECGHLEVVHGEVLRPVEEGDLCRAVPEAGEPFRHHGNGVAVCACSGWVPTPGVVMPGAVARDVVLKSVADQRAERDERLWALEKALDVLGALDEGPVLADVLAYAEYIRTGARP